MSTTEEDVRQPLDTPGVVSIIAKVKKGDLVNHQNIEEHKADKYNPHDVTAHQVGAYTQQETEDRISDALSGEVGGWLGNMTVAQVNALTTHKKGDSVTMLDAGTVNPGGVTVSVGDDLMWVYSLSEWQAKVSDHLHHDSTLVGTGATSDPLGVNPKNFVDVNFNSDELVFSKGRVPV